MNPYTTECIRKEDLACLVCGCGGFLRPIRAYRRRVFSVCPDCGLVLVRVARTEPFELLVSYLCRIDQHAPLRQYGEITRLPLPR